jgi:hypothetical protein
MTRQVGIHFSRGIKCREYWSDRTHGLGDIEKKKLKKIEKNFFA